MVENLLRQVFSVFLKEEQSKIYCVKCFQCFHDLPCSDVDHININALCDLWARAVNIAHGGPRYRVSSEGFILQEERFNNTILHFAVVSLDGSSSVLLYVHKDR